MRRKTSFLRSGRRKFDDKDRPRRVFGFALSPLLVRGGNRRERHGGQGARPPVRLSSSDGRGLAYNRQDEIQQIGIIEKIVSTVSRSSYAICEVPLRGDFPFGYYEE